MCDSCNPFEAEEDRVRAALVELYKSLKEYCLEFLAYDEEIRNYDWIENFFKTIRRMLQELKDKVSIRIYSR